MPWRFRRTLNIGPIRFTLEKTGIGISIGTKGLHIGRSPNGKLYVSAGVPGTGFYWRKDLSTAKRESVGATNVSDDPLEGISSSADKGESDRRKQKRYREHMRKKLQQQEGDADDVKE
jgi:hypothetical protein